MFIPFYPLIKDGPAYEEGEKVFLDKKIMIVNGYGKTIQSGESKFPFTCKVPQDIEPTLELKQSECACSKISNFDDDAAVASGLHEADHVLRGGRM